MAKGFQIQGEQWRQNLRMQEGQEGDPNAIARGREANPATRWASKKSGANWALTNVFPRYLDSILSNTTYEFDFNGQPVTFASARNNPRLMQTVARFALKQFVQDHGLQLDRRFIANGLNNVQRHITGLVNQASQIEIKNSYARQEQTNDAILRNDPESFSSNVVSVFRGWSDIPTLGFEGALNKYVDLANQQKPDGSFVYTMAQLENADLKGTGKTFKQEFPNRWDAMMAARDNALIKNAQTQNALENIGYQQRVRDTASYFAVEGNNTDANVNTAVAAFKDLYPHKAVPRFLLDLQKNGTIEIQQKATLTKQFLGIPSGLITEQDVYAAYQVDTALGTEIDKRYKNQKSVTNSSTYKEVEKTFATVANGITAIGTNKPNTPASLTLQTEMKKDLLAKADELLKGDVTIEQALLQAGSLVEAEVKAGFKDENSKWYRTMDGPGGSINFPGLNKGLIDAVETAARNWAQIKKDIADPEKGLDYVLNKPGALFSKQQGIELIRKYNTPYFTVPNTVRAVTALTKGGDPFVIINRGLTALGLNTLPESPALSSVKKTADPKLMQILYKTQSSNVSARVMGSGNTFNPALMPNNIGATVQQIAQTNNINPSATAALMQVAGQDHGKLIPTFTQAMQTLGNPVNAAMASLFASGNYSPAQLLAKRKQFTKAFYAYGGGAEALQATVRRASPVSTYATGPGVTVEAFKDEQGRPVVLSKPALSGLQLLIQMSNGVVNPKDITSSQRSHEHNKAVGGSPTSYHLEGTGRAIDIHGPSREWMLANPQLTAAAGWSGEPGYENDWHFVYGL
jgi:hypothetical protein